MLFAGNQTRKERVAGNHSESATLNSITVLLLGLLLGHTFPVSPTMTRCNYGTAITVLNAGQFDGSGVGHCLRNATQCVACVRVAKRPTGSRKSDFGAVRSVKTHIIGGIRSQTAACQRAALRVHGAGKSKAGRLTCCPDARLLLFVESATACKLSGSAPISTPCVPPR